MNDPYRGRAGCRATVLLPLKAPGKPLSPARPILFRAVQSGPGLVSRLCGACPAGVAGAGEQLAVGGGVGGGRGGGGELFCIYPARAGVGTFARRRSSVAGLYAYLVARGDTPVRASPVPRGLMTRRQGGTMRSRMAPLVRVPRTLPRILSPEEAGPAGRRAAHAPGPGDGAGDAAGRAAPV